MVTVKPAQNRLLEQVLHIEKKLKNYLSSSMKHLKQLQISQQMQNYSSEIFQNRQIL